MWQRKANYQFGRRARGAGTYRITFANNRLGQPCDVNGFRRQSNHATADLLGDLGNIAGNLVIIEKGVVCRYCTWNWLLVVPINIARKVFLK